MGATSSFDTALHPLGDPTIGADGFFVLGMGNDSGDRLRPRCPVCLGALMPLLGDGRGRFRHVSKEEGDCCPLSTLSYQPDGISVQHMRDAARERDQRGAFVANWQRHYQAMRRVVPSMSVRRFIHLVGYADVMNLWSYPALEQHDVPYVLLTLAQFMRAGSMAGKAVWVRFCFDATVRDVGDLWTHEGSQARFFRMMYSAPSDTPFPTSKQLIHYELVKRDTSFLEIPPAYIKRSDVKEFQRFAVTDRKSADPERANTGTP
ncbi:MAG TPA: hypothetical protein VGL08_15160 [Paraburkholderia sp.]